MKKNFFIGLAISIFCMYLVFRNIDLLALQRSLITVHYPYLVITILLIFVFSLLRAFRWKYLLEPVKKISTKNLFEMVMIGYLANNILPARIGEVVRAMILGKTEGISKISSLATIVMERIFDIITLLIIIGIASHYLPIADNNRHRLIMLSGGIFGLLFISILVLKYHKDWLWNTSRKILRPISPAIASRIKKTALAFLEGLQVLEQGGHLLMIFLLSGVIGLALGGVYYFVAIAFNIKLTMIKLLILISVVCLGTVIPSSPGFIGTFHYFCIKGLFLVGVKDKNLALSYALVVHLIQYIPESLTGLFFLWKRGVSFREIQTADVETEIN